MGMSDGAGRHRTLRCFSICFGERGRAEELKVQGNVSTYATKQIRLIKPLKAHKHQSKLVLADGNV